MLLVNLFIIAIYQPFFNILVFFYWIMDQVTHGHPDMGIAVIFLTILIRILLLPISLAGDKSEAERRQIAAKIKDLELEYVGDPVNFRLQKQKLLRQSKGVVAGEILSLVIQVIITLMLWRIFARGLEGADVHLLYSFMPKVNMPFNLVFLGKFDLSRPNVVLNITQSIFIFILETLSIYTSPYPPEKGEVVRLQLVLPLVSFFVFMFLPAGKKIFIITTLIFSIVVTLYKLIKHKFAAYKWKMEQKELSPTQEEKVVVEVK